MKAKRFTIVKRWIRWYPAGPMEMPQADGKYILATDADRLEAAISRKDDVIRKVGEWFATYKGMCMELFGCENGDIKWPSYPCQAKQVYDEMLAARAALEET